MRLTEAELAEGRRLLEAFISARDRRIPNIRDYNLATMAFRDWFSVHADALLARRKEIAREAVREFAERCCELLREKNDACTEEAVQSKASDYYNGIHGGLAIAGEAIELLSAARGATLEIKERK